MKKLFIHFLKQHNAYEQFMHNFNHREELHKCDKKLPFNRYYKHLSLPQTIIANAFVWSETKEGFTFWKKIQIQWIGHVRNHFFDE